MDASTALDRTTGLDAVRRRRAELGESLKLLEQSLAAPALGRAVAWGEQVNLAVAVMTADFREHVSVTEGPDGLHDAIVAGDLRLTNAVTALAAEHADITAGLVLLSEASEAPVVPVDVVALCEQATRLLAQVVRHRQRGADLIYEAFETDIGGGD
jgi:hypothetical protein